MAAGRRCGACRRATQAAVAAAAQGACWAPLLRLRIQRAHPPGRDVGCAGRCDAHSRAPGGFVLSRRRQRHRRLVHSHTKPLAGRGRVPAQPRGGAGVHAAGVQVDKVVHVVQGHKRKPGACGEGGGARWLICCTKARLVQGHSCPSTCSCKRRVRLGLGRVPPGPARTCGQPAASGLQLAVHVEGQAPRGLLQVQRDRHLARGRVCSDGLRGLPGPCICEQSERNPGQAA